MVVQDREQTGIGHLLAKACQQIPYLSEILRVECCSGSCIQPLSFLYLLLHTWSLLHSVRPTIWCPCGAPRIILRQLQNCRRKHIDILLANLDTDGSGISSLVVSKNSGCKSGVSSNTARATTREGQGSSFTRDDSAIRSEDCVYVQSMTILQ